MHQSGRRCRENPSAPSMTDTFQVPGANRWEIFRRFVRPDFVTSVNHNSKRSSSSRCWVSAYYYSSIPIPWKDVPFQAKIATSFPPREKQRCMEERGHASQPRRIAHLQSFTIHCAYLANPVANVGCHQRLRLRHANLSSTKDVCTSS